MGKSVMNFLLPCRSGIAVETMSTQLLWMPAEGMVTGAPISVEELKVMNGCLYVCGSMIPNGIVPGSVGRKRGSGEKGRRY